MIKLFQVTKTFNAGKANEFTALKDISLNIEPNRVTVFVGPSGSGKTTLLSVIGSMSRPSSGRIQVNGRETTSLPERFSAEARRKTFGFIFQNYNLIRGLTALENTMIPAYPTGLKHQRIEKRATDLLRRLDVGLKAHQKVEHLSGGEQQRIAIARALINEPPVVIADEPTAHLDTELASALLEILSQFKREGKTILIASHDPLIFESPIVDRIVSLRDGAIVSGGNVQ
jgi:putative ABC transport system ATP-binding protein